MAVMYVPAKADVVNLVQHVLGDLRGDLARAEVSVGVLMCSGTTDHPVKHNGYPAIATITVNPLKDRVQGMPDATIVLDQAWWYSNHGSEEASIKQAVIDHELMHLELVNDPELGGPTRDDAGRPKLKIRKHDWQIGGFTELVARWGNASQESIQVDAIAKTLKQAVLPFVRAGEEDAA